MVELLHTQVTPPCNAVTLITFLHMKSAETCGEQNGLNTTRVRILQVWLMSVKRSCGWRETDQETNMDCGPEVVQRDKANCFKTWIYFWVGSILKGNNACKTIKWFQGFFL